MEDAKQSATPPRLVRTSLCNTIFLQGRDAHTFLHIPSTW